MDIVLIKSEIRKVAKKTFVENNVPISETELNDDIKVFFNFIMSQSGYPMLDGISAEMMQALQSSLVDGIGKLSNLKSIATLFDAYTKKILVMSGKCTYSQVSNLTMMPLFKETNIIVPIPIIDDSTIASFNGRSSGLYIFGISYLTRNVVHNSPDWDISEIVERTRYVVSLYILVLHYLRNDLLHVHPEIAKDKKYEYGDNKESQTVYDFISFSSPTNKIKNQVVNSFISHLLYSEGMCKIDNLVRKVIDFSEGSLSQSAAQRLIQNLISKGILDYQNGVKTEIILSQQETERVLHLIEEYNDSLSLFHCEIDRLIHEFSLSIEKSELIKRLGTFFEYNFNLDIIESNGQECDKNTLIYYQEFLLFLKSGGVNDNIAEEIFESLLDICRQNDIVVRISAGRVFSKMSNPDLFGSYIRDVNHDVYLDTQILLYILCVNRDYLAYDNVFYRVAKSLIEINLKNKKFNFKVSSHYLSEIVFQLKQALFLIQFTEISNMPQCPISTNVFYRYFYWLRQENGLPDGVNTFREYMMDMFSLDEDDAFDKDYETIAIGVVESMLKEEYHIEIETTPRFESGISEVQELYTQVLKDNRCEEKPYKALLNDSLECKMLFDQPIDKPEPFFLTWDKSFRFMRPAYKKKFKRGSTSLFFHLFSPAKFINHVDLVDFKVNANTLSDDLLSLIETQNYKRTTYSIIDTINRFLDIPEMTQEKRKSYFKKLQKEIYQDDVFSYEQTELEQKDATNRKSFAFISQELFNHYKDKGQGYTKSYRMMLLDEYSFEQFIKIIFNYLNNELAASDVSKVISDVDKLVDTFNVDDSTAESNDMV